MRSAILLAALIIADYFSFVSFFEAIERMGFFIPIMFFIFLFFDAMELGKYLGENEN